ncbi:MAG: helix-turn-helix domain-containing protein [Flavobacteriales bacterium]|nr:helix-turn-helix domain-containing protein [Flavobacteriales bacterium]
MKQLSTKTLMALCSATNKSIGANKMLYETCKNLFRELQLEDLILYLYDPSKKHLYQHFTFGIKETIKNSFNPPFALSLNEGVVGFAAKFKKVQLIKNISNCSSYIRDIPNTSSELAVPIIFKGQPIGVIDSEHHSTHFYNHVDMSAFQIVASIISPLAFEVSQPKVKSPLEHISTLEELMKSQQLFLKSKLTLLELSSLMKLSPSYLSKIIKADSGLSFSDHLNSYRVNSAIEMMNDAPYKDYPMIDIAIESGFGSKASFNRAFLRHKGITPTQFKK